MNHKMNICFLLDVGQTVGFGHFYRCKVLADLCLGQGWNVNFLVTSEGYLELPEPIKSFYQFTFVANEKELFTHLNGSKVLFVDHYGKGEDLEEKMGAYVDLVVALDDIGRLHHCDLLIDYYSGLFPDDLLRLNASLGEVLSGKDYALIDARYTANIVRKSFSKINKLLLYLGTVDPSLVSKVLDALKLNPANSSKEIVVLSSTFPTQEDSFFAHFQVQPFSQNLDLLYQKFDFVIGSAGVAMMERLALKVPGINFVCVDNQKGMINQFKNDALHFFAEDLRGLENIDVRKFLDRAFEAFQAGDQAQCHCGIDGKGAQRIFDKIVQLVKNES